MQVEAIRQIPSGPRVKHAGTWVILADPEDVKRVFTADHAVLGVGLANSILGPLLGPRSVMLLEEPEHVKRRKLMLPPFHGERMKDYSEMMADVTRREMANWPMNEPFELWPRMQEITLEAIMRVVFGPVETDRLRRLRHLLRKLTNWMNDPRRLNLLAAAGPARFAGNNDYREMMGPVEDAVLEEVRRRQQDPGCTDGTDIAAMLGEAQYEDGSPMTEQDLRDELVTLLADGPTSSLLVVVRASLAPSGEVRSAEDRGRRGRRGGIPRCGRKGDDAPMPGRADRGAQAACADGAWRVHPPRRDHRGALRAPGAPARGYLSRAFALSSRAVPRAACGHLHLDSLWRGGQKVPCGELRATPDEASHKHRYRRGRHAPGGPELGAPAQECDLFRTSQACDRGR
jgi:hypothetical protein